MLGGFAQIVLATNFAKFAQIVREALQNRSQGRLSLVHPSILLQGIPPMKESSLQQNGAPFAEVFSLIEAAGRLCNYHSVNPR
jgi:hypothetical protein